MGIAKVGNPVAKNHHSRLAREHQIEHYMAVPKDEKVGGVIRVLC